MSFTTTANALERIVNNMDELDGYKDQVNREIFKNYELEKENSFLKKQYEKVVVLEQSNKTLKDQLEDLQHKLDTKKDKEENVKLFIHKPTSSSLWGTKAPSLTDYDRFVENYVTDAIPLRITNTGEKDGFLDDGEDFDLRASSRPLATSTSEAHVCNFQHSGEASASTETSASENSVSVDDSLLRDIEIFQKIPLLNGYLKATLSSTIHTLKSEQATLRKAHKEKIQRVFSSIMRNPDDTKSYKEKQDAVNHFFSGKQPGTCNYHIPKVSEGERKNMCGVNEYKKQHKFVAHYLSPWSDARGILAWHSLGSGKTSIAVLTCAHHLREFYVFAKSDARVIIFIVKKELIPNFNSEFRKYIPYEYVFGEPVPANAQEKTAKIDRVFRDRVFVTTYHDLCASLMGRKQWNGIPPEIARGLHIHNGKYIADSAKQRILENTLLIIDEAHNLVRPEKCDRGTFGQSSDYNVIADPFILKNCVQQTKNIKILLMTATPVAEKLSEFGILINFMKHREEDAKFMFPEIGDALRVKNIAVPSEARRPNLKKTEEAFQREFFEDGKMKNQDLFLQNISGWVSYFENTKDLNYYPSQRIQEVVTVMSSAHRLFYDEAKKLGTKSTKTLQDTAKLRLEFTKIITATRGVKTMTKSTPIAEISTKLLAVLENIKIGASLGSRPEGTPQFGKQLLFTPFPSSEVDRIYSSISITKILESTTTFGRWKKLEMKHFEQMQRFMKHPLGRVEAVFPEIGERMFEIFDEKPFVQYISELTGGDASTRFMIDLNSLVPGSAAVPAVIRDMVKELYNSTWNAEGEKINLLLFNKKFSEGISYFNVRTVHVVGTPLSLLDRDQAVGRAIRYCSHKRLEDLEKWNVTVFNYIMVFSEEEKQRYLSGSFDWMTTMTSLKDAAKTTVNAMMKGGRGGGGGKQSEKRAAAKRNSTRKGNSLSTECDDIESSLQLCRNGTPISADIVMQQVAKMEASKFRTFLDLAKVGSVDCPLFREVNDLPLSASNKPLPCFQPLRQSGSTTTDGEDDNSDDDGNRDGRGDDHDNDDDDYDYDSTVPCSDIDIETKCNNREHCTWSKSSNFFSSTFLGSKGECVSASPKKCDEIQSSARCNRTSLCHVNPKSRACEQRIDESWFGDWKFAIAFESDTNLVVPFSFPSLRDIDESLNNMALYLKARLKKKGPYSGEEGPISFGTDILYLLNCIRFKFNYFLKETIGLQKEVSNAIYESMTTVGSSGDSSDPASFFRHPFVVQSFNKFASYYNRRLNKEIVPPTSFELETKLYQKEGRKKFFQVELNSNKELKYFLKLSIDTETNDDIVYYVDSNVSDANIVFDETMQGKEDFSITKSCRAYPLYPFFKRSAPSYLKCLVTFRILKVAETIISLSSINLVVVSRKKN